jgi:heptaprenyl diphosphate synthase
VTAQAWEVAQHWADDAVASLHALPDGAVKEALAGFAQAVVARTS